MASAGRGLSKPVCQSTYEVVQFDSHPDMIVPSHPPSPKIRCLLCLCELPEAYTLCHIYHHFNYKPYRCTLCGTDFVGFDFLQRHALESGHLPVQFERQQGNTSLKRICELALIYFRDFAKPEARESVLNLANLLRSELDSISGQCCLDLDDIKDKLSIDTRFTHMMTLSPQEDKREVAVRGLNGNHAHASRQDSFKAGRPRMAAGPVIEEVPDSDVEASISGHGHAWRARQVYPPKSYYDHRPSSHIPNVSSASNGDFTSQNNASFLQSPVKQGEHDHRSGGEQQLCSGSNHSTVLTCNICKMITLPAPTDSLTALRIEHAAKHLAEEGANGFRTDLYWCNRDGCPGFNSIQEYVKHCQRQHSGRSPVGFEDACAVKRLAPLLTKIWTRAYGRSCEVPAFLPDTLVKERRTCEGIDIVLNRSPKGSGSVAKDVRSNCVEQMGTESKVDSASESPKTEKSIECEICGSEVSGLSTASHVWDFHVPGATFRCMQCNAVLSTRTAAEWHKTKSHPGQNVVIGNNLIKLYPKFKKAFAQCFPDQDEEADSRGGKESGEVEQKQTTANSYAQESKPDKARMENGLNVDDDPISTFQIARSSTSDMPRAVSSVNRSSVSGEKTNADDIIEPTTPKKGHLADTAVEQYSKPITRNIAQKSIRKARKKVKNYKLALERITKRVPLFQKIVKKATRVTSNRGKRGLEFSGPVVSTATARIKCKLCHKTFGNMRWGRPHVYSHINEKCPVLQCTLCDFTHWLKNSMRMHILHAHKMGHHNHWVKYMTDNMTVAREHYKTFFDMCFDEKDSSGFPRAGATGAEDALEEDVSENDEDENSSDTIPVKKFRKRTVSKTHTDAKKENTDGKFKRPKLHGSPKSPIRDAGKSKVVGSRRNFITKLKPTFKTVQKSDRTNFRSQSSAQTSADSQLHPSQRYHKCKLCKELARGSKGLAAHVFFHVNKKHPVYECPSCNFSYSRRWEVANHILRVHKGSDIKECRRLVVDNTDKVKKHFDRFYTQCYGEPSQAVLSRRSLQTSTSKTLASDSPCRSESVQSSPSKSPKRKKGAPKSEISCQLCDTAVSVDTNSPDASKSCLIAHAQTHCQNGTRMRVCSVCSYRCFDEKGQDNHTTAEHGDNTSKAGRKIKWKMGKVDRNTSEYGDSMVLKCFGQNLASLPGWAEKFAVCFLCQLVIRTKGARKHLKQHCHEKLPLFPCNKCDAGFFKINELTSHKKTEHGGPGRFQTNYMGKTVSLKKYGQYYAEKCFRHQMELSELLTSSEMAYLESPAAATVESSKVASKGMDSPKNSKKCWPGARGWYKGKYSISTPRESVTDVGQGGDRKDQGHKDADNDAQSGDDEYEHQSHAENDDQNGVENDQDQSDADNDDQRGADKRENEIDADDDQSGDDKDKHQSDADNDEESSDDKDRHQSDTDNDDQNGLDQYRLESDADNDYQSSDDKDQHQSDVDNDDQSGDGVEQRHRDAKNDNLRDDDKYHYQSDADDDQSGDAKDQHQRNGDKESTPRESPLDTSNEFTVRDKCGVCKIEVSKAGREEHIWLHVAEEQKGFSRFRCSTCAQELNSLVPLMDHFSIAHPTQELGKFELQRDEEARALFVQTAVKCFPRKVQNQREGAN